MKEHEVKIDEKYLISIKKGEKKAEVRKNDRNYRVGDFLVFLEKDKTTAARIMITHILTHDDFPEGIMPGYAVLSFEREAHD